MREVLAALSPRGRLTPGFDLSRIAWLKVGGPAEALFQPADADDLAETLRALPPDVPVTPLGVCSNLIIRDGGLPGLAVKLGRGFTHIMPQEGARLRVGAGALDSAVAKAAARAGIAGLEFLRTIPGAIGGAVRMNAGCYGAYTADVFHSAVAVTRAGDLVRLPKDDIAFSYRSCDLAQDLILTEVTLQGRPGSPERSEALMADYIAKREASQPTKERSCGSTFRNPAGYSSTGAADDPMEMKAWKLIEDAGCRGLRLGGAQISEKHANFLINAGGATAADLENLGEEVRKRVSNRTGIRLEWEIMRIGENPGR